MLLVLAGCDKTLPAAAMALARLDVPGIVVYGGFDPPGPLQGAQRHRAGRLRGCRRGSHGTPRRGRSARARGAACPGASACGGQFTANTMAMALSLLGLSPMTANDVPAVDARKSDAVRAAGKCLMQLVTRGTRPRAILSRASFENAIAGVAATGGSTNAVLHLLAIAHEAGVPTASSPKEPAPSRARRSSA